MHDDFGHGGHGLLLGAQGAVLLQVEIAEAAGHAEHQGALASAHLIPQLLLRFR